MNDTPLVSIIIRTKDRPGLLREALGSIAAQTYRPLEVVLVNDGGRGLDHTELQGVLNDVSLSYVWFEQSRGRATAANAGIAKAAGEYIGFLDDDDLLYADHVALLQGICAGSEPKVAYSSVQAVYYQLAQDGKTAGKKLNNSHLYADEFNPSRLLFENYIPLNALLFHRDCLAGEQFDEQLDINEDWDLLIRLSRRYRFVHFPQVTAEYRLFPKNDARQDVDQISEDRGSIHAGWLQKVFDKNRSFITGRDWDLFYRGFIIPKHEREMEFVRGLLVSEQNRLNSMVTERERELAERDLMVTQRDGELEKQNALIQKRDKEIAQLGRNIAQLGRNIAQLNADIEKINEERNRLNGEVMQKDGELVRLGTELRQRDEEIARIINSESWKVTYPLRQIGKFARFIRRGARYAGRNNPVTVLRRLVVEVYHSPLVGSWLRLFPPSVKQRVKSWLLARGEALPTPVILPEDPRVSIIIPVFNHAEYLDKCIGSAVGQDYDNVEVVIVDDFSTDPRVRKILEKYGSHPRVKLLFNEKNSGISETQNRAIINSAGDIIAFLDCDDYLSPDAVSSSLKHWAGSTVYLHTARTNVDKNDNVVSRISFEHLPRADYFTENLEGMYATHFKMIRKDAFAKVGLFDPRFNSAQDYDMLMRIAFHCPNEAFVFVPNFVYYHRFHDLQDSSRNEDRQTDHTATIQREARLRKDISMGIFSKGVSIIMLSYGKYEQTYEAIQSIISTVRIPFEIILFDNASDSETENFLRSEIDGKFPCVRVFYNDVNLGPAGGRRQALAHAKGPYYVVFDNDEIAQPGWIEELLVRGESGPDIGGVVARVYFPDNKLQFSGGGVRYIDHELIELTRYDVKKSWHDESTALFRECEWVPIGATLFKINPAPFLHAGYQNIFEDAGVSFALKKEGYRLVNAPGALVLHNHFMFRDKISMRKKYLEDRYRPEGMLRAIASFYGENGLIIYDEYAWKENGLNALSREELKKKLEGILESMDMVQGRIHGL